MRTIGEIIEDIEMYLTMEIPMKNIYDDPGPPYTVERFPISYKSYLDQGVDNRMGDLRRLFKELREAMRNEG